jgi:hypothetical protein
MFGKQPYLLVILRKIVNCTVTPAHSAVGFTPLLPASHLIVPSRTTNVSLPFNAVDEGGV